MELKEILNDTLNDARFPDTRVGTNSRYEFSNGNTLPYTGVPYGQNYIVTQTSSERGSWWFNPHSKNFEGFRITHQPSPWMGDFSTFTVLPFISKPRAVYNGFRSIFRPNFNLISYLGGQEAIASACRYGTIIKFDANENLKYQIKGEGLTLKKVGDTIEGSLVNFSDSRDKDFTMYLYMTINAKYDLIKEDGAYVIETDQTSAELKIAMSFISLEQAKFNHQHMAKDIGDMIANSKNMWASYFDKIKIEKNNDKGRYEKYEAYNADEQIKFFYQAMYRSFLFPMTMYEYSHENGREIHYDTSSKSVKDGKLFTNIGFWDGSKTLFPLLALIAQDDFEDILEGILNSYKDSGYLPKWLSPDERGLMPGTLVDNVIAEAAAKDIGSNMMEELLDAMIKSATKASGEDRYGRAGVDDYKELGYVPKDYHESVNQTLDNSLSDYSIGMVAKKLGREEISAQYFEKSRNYLNLFDPQTKFLRSKDRQGEFNSDTFDPLTWGSPYTEGSAYQNSYNMYHDFDYFIQVYGGKEEFEKRLDEIANSKTKFNVGEYGQEIHEMTEYKEGHFGHIAISNQPSFHLPYLYNYVDKPYKTQIIVKELLLNYFKNNYDGYPGDEDNGSLSAWYILSSLGFYPVLPGSNVYQLGIGLWDKASIKLSDGKELTIKVNENYHHKKFVDKIEIDGEIFNSREIDYEIIKNADTIELTLGIVPRA